MIISFNWKIGCENFQQVLDLVLLILNQLFDAIIGGFLALCITDKVQLLYQSTACGIKELRTGAFPATNFTI
jgi:hypothetical protein